jgi:predicted nucleic acid-binding protein
MKVLFDSSIYIRSLRDQGVAGLALLRWLGPAPIWGSSVVLEELYAGVSVRDHRILQKLEPLAKFPTLAFALVVAVFLLDLEGK